MNLRGKLLLAQAPLCMALVVVGTVAVWALSELGASSQRILDDNYRSTLAAERMKEAIARLDRDALLITFGGTQTATVNAAQQSSLFAAELEAEQQNITEPGEQAAADQLAAAWNQYQQKLAELEGATSVDQRKQQYFGDLEPALAAVDAAAERVHAINQDAMRAKSSSAAELARRKNWQLVLATLAALLIGVALCMGLTNHLLEPLSALTQAAARLGKGDFAARVSFRADDEIALLSAPVQHHGRALGRVSQ